MISASLIRRYRFMRDNAGYIVGRRAELALKLAKAELALQNAIEAGVARVNWVEDWDCDWSWLEQPEFNGYEPKECFGCVIEVRCATCGSWTTVESLWGIVDPDSAYFQVIEAELALEALESLEVAA